MTDFALDASSAPLSDAAEVRPAASAKAWLAVLSVSLGAFASVTTEFLPVGLLPAIARDLHVSDGVAGLMITVPGVAAAIAAPAVTIFSGRLDRRRLLWLLMAMLVLSNALSAVAPNFAVMLLGRLLLGIALGGFWAIAASLAGRLVPQHHAGRALAMILAGISVGTIVGVPAGVVIAGAVGWRGTFGLVGVVAAGVLVKQFVVLPSLPTATAVRLSHLTGLFRHRAACVGLLAGAFVINGQFAAYTYVTPFLEQVAKVTAAQLGSILLGFGLAGFVGNFIAGFTADRFLRRTFATLIVLMAGGALLLPVLGHSPTAAGAVLLVWGVGFGALPMCVQLWTMKSAPEAPESASAVLVCVFQVCIALGAGWGGRLVDTTSTSAVMFAGGSVMVIGLVTLLVGGPAPSGARPVGAMAH